MSIRAATNFSNVKDKGQVVSINLETFEVKADLRKPDTVLTAKACDRYAGIILAAF